MKKLEQTIVLHLCYCNTLARLQKLYQLIPHGAKPDRLIGKKLTSKTKFPEIFLKPCLRINITSAITLHFVEINTFHIFWLKNRYCDENKDNGDFMEYEMMKIALVLHRI